MKYFFNLLLITAMPFIFKVNAQETHLLMHNNDALLMQLIQQKKNIHFSINQNGQQPAINFYEQPANEVANGFIGNSFSKTSANNFHLTKDINEQTDANPSNSDFVSARPFAILKNVMYFAADDGINGSELWRSDGTAAGTYLVKDIQPGNNSSSPSEIITASNKLYFITQSPHALWISDGTSAGTTELLDLGSSGPGVNGSFDLANTLGTVYFLKGSPYNTQVWKTDGTIAGTMMVKDLTGLGQSPTLTAAANGLYYFTIFNFQSGRELWRSNGTDAGTFMLKDISDTTDYFDGPFQLTAFNNKLYFSADDGKGRTLWFTDGTEAGTQKAEPGKKIILSTDFSDEFVNKPFAIQLNNLYLSASTPSTGNELFKYNINNGFSLVEDIIPGARGGLLYNITNADNFIAFVYQDTLAKKTQLWATLGFPYTTFLIKTADDYSSFFSSLTYNNAQLFFTSNTKNYGLELWKTNGTAGTTQLVKDIYKGTTGSAPLYLTSFKNGLYFNAASKFSGTELWKSGGTAESTTIVKEINNTSTDYSGPNYFNKTAIGGDAGAAIGNKLFFSATKPETGYEVYTSDGTNAGTTLFRDVNAGETGSNPQTFTSKNKSVYFIAYSKSNTGDYWLNLFKIDSIGNTTQLSDNSYGYISTYSVADNGNVFYVVFPFSGMPQLWKNNGTAGGNVKLSDSIATTIYPITVKTVHNKAFFAATSVYNGTELWVSDGTVAGTKMVKDLAAGSNSSDPYSLYPYDNKIFFGADDGSGVALWMSDGTGSGTIKLKTIQPYNSRYNGMDYNNFFCEVNGILYMNVLSANKGTELWRTNGTAAGTRLVKDIAPGADNSNPSYLTNVNGNLFFAAFDQQLWKSDGTANGTVLVKDLSGSSYYAFNERCVADGKFFFNKDQLLWVSDGTDAGTHPVYDNGLNNVSLVSNLAVAGNTVFFNGYTDKYNYELYAGDAAKVQTQTIAAAKNATQTTLTATVLQNPVMSALNLKINSLKDQSIVVAVSNEQGVDIISQKYILRKGVNIINVNASNWYNGIYTVNVKNTDGEAISLHVLK